MPGTVGSPPANASDSKLAHMLMRASRFNTALEALDAPTRQHDMMQVVAHLSVHRFAIDVFANRVPGSQKNARRSLAARR